MPTVTRPKEQAKYHEGRPNTVLSVVPIKMVGVKFTGSDCREETAIALVFGTNNEDGGAGVWIMANEAEMGKTLRIANKAVRQGVRTRLALDSDPNIDDVPADLGTVDVTDTESVDSTEGGSVLDTLSL